MPREARARAAGAAARGSGTLVAAVRLAEVDGAVPEEQVAPAQLVGAVALEADLAVHADAVERRVAPQDHLVPGARQLERGVAAGDDVHLAAVRHVAGEPTGDGL